MGEKKELFNSQVAAKKIQRIALEIAEQLNNDPKGVTLLGIRKNGPAIVNELARLLQAYVKRIRIGTIAMNKQEPTDIKIEGIGEINDQNIVIVDDVSNSGRTLLYAIKPLLDHRPKSIRTVVLVERKHKQFPVTPDHVGLSVATTLEDHIQVEVENDKISGAYLI